MKIFTEIVVACEYCYEKRYGMGESYKCNYTRKTIPDIKTIPDWCPLEDYQEED